MTTLPKPLQNSLQESLAKPFAACAFAALALGATALPVTAQSPQQFYSAALVPQDFSDCNNSNVKGDLGTAPGGTVYLTRQSDGSLALKVGITATPNTKYNFFWKCQRQLGVISTGDEGTGEGNFTIPPGVNMVTFDMYPDGAPAGNKFQSVPVTVQ